MKITKPLNLALVALAGFTFACGGGDKTSETTSTPAVETPEKVINGGVGAWGEIPMPPHAALSLEDAKDMVSYVLLLKK